ncbi:MAG TPA: hypothetical protein VFF32_15595, partial [Dermatophilaceae bacterium]|nr:hypothetical protein [Dermatophilaceae bacterium]
YGDAKGAPSGSVRTEIEARSDWCSRVGMTRVEDVTVERCEQLLMERWDWTAFGTAVAPGFDVVERVKRYRDEDGDLLSSAVRARLIGHLVEEALGHDPRMSKNTATVYRRLKRRLGVVPSPALLSARTGEPRRLDFYVGTEVSV